MLHTRFHAIGKRWMLVRMTVFAAGLAGLVPAQGQQPPSNGTQDPSASQLTSGQTSSTKNDPNAEVTTQDSGTTFRLRVSLVQVHVVVRDANGNPVGNLKQEIFDANGNFVVGAQKTLEMKLEDATYQKLLQGDGQIEF